MTAFKEKKIFSGSYSHVSDDIKNNLLKNVERNASDIGIRFKMKGNGHIINPASNNNTEKYTISTDSFAFIGLIKR